MPLSPLTGRRMEKEAYTSPYPRKELICQGCSPLPSRLKPVPLTNSFMVPRVNHVKSEAIYLHRTWRHKLGK